MARNDEGDFELVLGNKQLLSVFFIVVVLLGVFFTMGYIVGRNSSQEAAARMAMAPGQPLVVEPAPGEGTSSPAATAPGPTVAPPKAVTQPARKPAPPPAETAKRPAPPPKPAAEPAPVPTRPPAAAGGISEPPPGQIFWQVAATSRDEAQLLLNVLGKRGFKGRLAPVPGRPELYRVLVGPLAGSEELTRTKARLEAAGFKPFRRQY